MVPNIVFFSIGGQIFDTIPLAWSATCVCWRRHELCKWWVINVQWKIKWLEQIAIEIIKLYGYLVLIREQHKTHDVSVEDKYQEIACNIGCFQNKSLLVAGNM